MNNTVYLDLEIFNYETDTTEAFIKGLAGEDVYSNMEKIDDAIGTIYFDINALNETTTEFSNDLLALQSENQTMRSDISSLQTRVDALDGGNSSGGSSSLGGTSGNLLINGSFDFWSNGEEFTDITDGYTADRWKFTTTGVADINKYTYLLDDSNGIKIKIKEANKSYNLYQRVDIPNGIYDLTLSFEIIASVDNTTANAMFCENESFDDTLISYSPTTTFNRVTLTQSDFAVSTKELYISVFNIPADLDFEGVEFVLRNIKLEFGETATTFYPKTLVEEKLLIERYNGEDKLPDTPTDGGGSSTGGGGSTGSTSNQNLLLNGKFNIYQRYKTTTLVENEYFIDRWKTYPPMTTTGLNVRRYNGDEDDTYIIGAYTSESADYTIGQTVEIPNGTYTFTLSFEACTDAWMTDEVIVNCELRPTEDERSITQTYGITADWQSYVFTFTNVSIEEKLLRVILMATNSSSECEDATMYYRNVKLEYGENATPDIPVSYDEELRKCQRYFYKYNNSRDSYVKFAHMFTSLGVLIYTDSHVQNLRGNPTAINNVLNPVVAVGNSEYDITVTNDSNNQCLHMSCTAFSGFEDGRAYIIKNMPSLDAELYD